MDVYDDANIRDYMRDLRKQITSDIVESIDDDLDITMGYGYSATRDESTEYGFTRRKFGGEDNRIIFDGNGPRKANYEEHLQDKGLERKHPTRKGKESSNDSVFSEEMVEEASGNMN